MLPLSRPALRLAVASPSQVDGPAVSGSARVKAPIWNCQAAPSGCVTALSTPPAASLP